MISSLAYKFLHVLGVLFTFAALGGVLLHTLNGGTRDSNRARRLTSVSFLLGMVLILISGFGLVAVMSYGFPLWVWLKIAVWVALGASLAMIPRFPRHAGLLWWLVPLLGGAAAWLCFFKPGI